MILRKFFILTLILATTYLTGCQGDECDASYQQPECLETLGCGDLAHYLMVDTESDFELIRSQEQYDAKVSGDCQPTIDWLQYDLVIGNVSIPNELESISKQLSRDCANNVINLNITVKMTAATRPEMISWSALIPKLGDDETLFVNL